MWPVFATSNEVRNTEHVSVTCLIVLQYSRSRGIKSPYASASGGLWPIVLCETNTYLR